MSSLPRPDIQSSVFVDDLTALERYSKRGDPSAFDFLAQRYQQMVFSTCQRVLKNESDAEDAAQETFLKLARHAGTIRSHTGAWLHAAAMGCSIDLIRRSESRRRAEETAGRIGAVHQSGGSEEFALWAEIEPILDEAIAGLDEADRELIVGRFLCDRSQHEMAVELGFSDGTVQRRTTRALSALHKNLSARGLAVLTSAPLAGALVYSSMGHGSGAFGGAISKIGLVGVTTRTAQPALMSKFVMTGVAFLVVGVLGLSLFTMTNRVQLRGGSAGIIGVGSAERDLGPERPAGKIGPFEIVSAGERNLFDRGVWITSEAFVIHHGVVDETGEIKSARLKILNIDDSEDTEDTVILKTFVERIEPIDDPWSRFKIGKRVEIAVRFDDVGRIVLTPITDGVQLGRNEPKWYGVRPPIGWQEHGRIPDDAGEFGVFGPWTEAERIPFTITAREIRFGSDSWVAALYRIIEWEQMDGYSRVLSVHAGGRDPRLIGTRFRLLVREEEDGYSIAYFLPGTQQSYRWPSSFEYSADNPVQIVRIDGDG